MTKKREVPAEMDVDAVLQRVATTLEGGRRSTTPVGEVLGVPHNTIRTWRQRGKVPADRLVQWAGECNVTVDWLIRGESALQRIADTFDRPPMRVVPTTLDVSLLAETLKAVTEGLQERSITLAPDVLAELVTVIYEREAAQRVATPGRSDVQGTTARVLRLVRAG